MDSSARGSSVHGISQARILEWTEISFFRGSSQPRDQTHISMSPALAGRFFTTESIVCADKLPEDEPEQDISYHSFSTLEMFPWESEWPKDSILMSLFYSSSR